MIKNKVRGFVAVSAASLLAIGLAFGPAASATVPAVNELVSVNSAGTNGGNAGSGVYSSISGDGRYVAFYSTASDLVAGDTNGNVDVFVRDTVNNTTTLASVSSTGAQGNGNSGSPRISYDGRFVVFSSAATNFDANDTNGKYDIYERDMQAGTTTLVSVNASGVLGDQSADISDVSADGRFVVFDSPATNLVSGVSGYGVGPQVYIKDMHTGALKALSVDSGGTRGNAGSFYPRINCSGNVVVFGSNASNLVTGDTNGASDAFMAVIGWGDVELTNVTVGGNGSSGSPEISCDGNNIAYYSAASNLISGYGAGVYKYSRLTHQNVYVSLYSNNSTQDTSAIRPTISGDGRYVAFLSYNALDSYSSPYAWAGNIYVRDTKGQTTQSVSRDASLLVNWTEWPAISADGSHISYDNQLSGSSPYYGQLDATDSNSYPDIYISETGF